MGWTKRQFVDAAYAKLGLGKSQYALQPEDYENALLEMDAMMATWEAKGLSVGYPIEFTPSESNIDDETEVTLSANSAIYLNLALVVAPNIGKVVSPELREAARIALRALGSHLAEIPEMDFSPTMPRGSGHRRGWITGRRRFFGTPSVNDAGKDNDNVIEGKEL